MKRTMTIRIGFGFLLVIFLLLSAPWPAQLAAVKEMILPSAAQQDQQPPRDTQGPLVAITTPARDSSHNVFPSISGTVEDKEQPGPTPQQTIPPSGVARVQVVIYSYENQKYWNGTGWVATNDPLGFALPARLSGTTWTLDAGLPSGDTLNLGKYFVAAIAFDNANNRGDGYTEIFLSRFFITLWDANATFADQLDFSDEHQAISDSSLARLAARLHGQAQGLQGFDPSYGYRRGAVADGTTKILILVEGHTPGPLNFQRKFHGIRPIGQDALTQINGNASAENIQPIASAGDKYLWLALYTTPDGIEKNTDFFTPQRIEFTATMNGGRKQDASLAMWFTLQPPPVLLIHGLNSTGGAWDGKAVMNKLQGDFLDVYVADYEKTNRAHFANNQYVPLTNERDGIAKILTSYRESGIACTQVDVVGHSMGGLLTRQYLKTPNYRNKHNFNQGYVRHLITIGTPHLGSELANLARFITLQSTGERILDFASVLFGNVLPQRGALEDLQVGSAALANLGPTKVRGFAIVGQYDPLIDLVDEELKLAYNVFKFMGLKLPEIDDATLSSFYKSLFLNKGSDLVVSVSSQRGGLGQQFFDIFMPVTHLGETDFEAIARKVETLLRSPRETFAEEFPSPSDHFFSTSLTEAVAKLEAKQAAINEPVGSESSEQQTMPLMDIAAPTEDSVFSLLTPIPLRLSALNGANVKAALVMVNHGVLALPSRGTSANPSPVELLGDSELTAPLLLFPTSSGRIQVKAFARDDRGNFSEVTRNIFVRGDSPLLVNPPLLELPAGETQQLTVIAFNLAGTVDDITSDQTGTRYESNNANVVTVNQKGLVTAISPGNADIAIRNGERQTSVAVAVIGKPPSLLEIAPDRIESGTSSATLAIKGFNLKSTSRVEFWHNGKLDRALTASNLKVQTNESLDTLTVNLQIAANAASGPRTVVVVTQEGVSASAPRAGNGLMIEGNERPPLPAPKITAIDPAAKEAGGAQFSLIVNGASFVAASQVMWNGAPRATVYESPTRLRATIQAADIAKPGIASVMVTNPSDSGRASNAVTFNILQPNNPVPALTQISPNSATAGSANLTLTVTGRNFVNAAKVRWNGVEKTTSFVSATELKATITATDIAAPGVASITVFNPAPGGGTSNTLSLTINPPTSGGDAELEPNETSAQATPLTLPGKRIGSVAVGDAAYWVVNYQDGTRDALEDFFALTVTQSSIVELKLTAANTAADLDLFLFKEENQSLSYLGYSVAGPGLEERFVTPSALAPGRYLVAVSAFSGSSSYTLTASIPDSRLLSLNFNNTLNGEEGESPLSSTGVNFSQGIRGSGLSLPASNQLFYGSAGNINSTEGTIELWIKPNWNGNDSKHHYILQHGNAGGLLIGKDSANNLRLILNRYGAAGGVEIDTGFNIADWRSNQWQHIAFTWSSSQKTIRIYVNGLLKASRSFNQMLPAINSDRIRIGGDGNSGFLEAVIDEMGIYNVALSANQILARSQTP